MRDVHDRFFKAIFSQREHAEAHLRAYLDPDTLRALDLATMRPAPTEHISDPLDERAGDLRYLVEGQGQTWIFRLAFESQSTGSREMPLRFGWYSLFEIMAHQRTEAEGPLPVVYPMVLYHGEAPWRGPRKLSEMYGQPPPHLMALPHVKPIEVQPHLIDLWRIPDEALHRGALGGLPLMALKYGRDADLVDRLEAWQAELNAAWRRADRDAIFTSLLAYWSHANPQAGPTRYRDALTRLISREAGEVVMNKYQEAYQNAWQKALRQGEALGLAQGMERGIEQGLERGIEQGLERGIEQGQTRSRVEMVMKMLTLKFGEEAEAARAAVEAASEAEIDAMLPRILSEASLSAVLSGE